jgi:hypothetical protein
MEPSERHKNNIIVEEDSNDNYIIEREMILSAGQGNYSD